MTIRKTVALTNAFLKTKFSKNTVIQLQPIEVAVDAAAIVFPTTVASIKR
jgi:hypothetical protein